MNDPTPNGKCHRLRAIGGAEFLQDVVDVALHGTHCEAQGARDAAVILTLRHEMKDVAFTIGQLRAGETLGQARGYNRGHAAPSGVDSADRLE